MSRRRFLTAQELADELRVPLSEVMQRIEAGSLRVMAPTKREVMAARERGGGLDLLGQYAPNGLTDWLRVYLRMTPPITDPARARRAGMPYTDGTRVYVAPQAVAQRVRGQFYPNPTYARVAEELRKANAQRGRALGTDPDHPTGRLIWWRLPPTLLQEVM